MAGGLQAGVYHCGYGHLRKETCPLWSRLLGSGCHWLLRVTKRPAWRGNFPIAGNIVWPRGSCSLVGNGLPELKTFVMEGATAGKAE